MCILPGGGQLSSAAIVGQDGGVWAQSVGFPAITKSEVDALLAGLEDPSKLAMTGIVLGGEKVRALPGDAASCRLQLTACFGPLCRVAQRAARQFFSIGGEPGTVIRGKKGPGGCTIKKTVTALVVGVYSEGVSPGDCSVVVENLGDYLSGQGI